MSDTLSGLEEAFDDIQALVGTGFTRLRRGHYLLLQVDDAARVRCWLAGLLAQGLVHALDAVRRPHVAGQAAAPAEGQKTRLTESVTVAFSHAGLSALGLADAEANPFPSAFRGGMAEPVRRELLDGDAVSPWRWGDVDTEAVHLLVAHFWADEATPSRHLDPALLADWGLRAHVVATCPASIDPPTQPEPGSREPFGFRDGLSQPVPEGIAWSQAEIRARRQAGKALFDDRRVALGEFVLGHANEYREAAYCPGLAWASAPSRPFARFGRNGSYMAVRQIAQHVDVLRAFEATCPVPDIAERMMGRRRDGRSLAALGGSQTGLDGFRYLQDDADGFGCPRGAHVRRANPRDALSGSPQEGVASARLHRLLRRGRVYAEAGATESTCEIGQGQGLMFIALNADLDRQFEFIQRSWIGGPRFGGLHDEEDPILGTAPGRGFTVQGLPVGLRIGGLPRFTTVVGGGYFFLPGLAALAFIAAGPPSSA
ncbi:Dyp-type peroxidase [Variovorax sp. PAMC 28711]|uniref:Dyp-type peroxidase n=1 Tax=Variovorax sp. PAMC 28711 TaxID=1795631 RepID=UPI00078EB65C|nr:Dyp-type peroxidase domain-containing protein [Variovorax sp. PAMC 28711]AMM24903.1 hypothetical protein AX767_11440 [Variovorax sp. PAMC 28711]